MKHIPGYSKYLASEDGRVVSKKTGLPVQQKFRKDGYVNVLVSPDCGPKYKLQLEHRLICKAFHGDSYLEVNHIDGDKMNNRPDNLEWVTRSQNIKHSIEVIGNTHVKKSFKNGNARISKENHLRLVKWHKSGILEIKELAKFFNVCTATISNHIRHSKRILKTYES